MRPIKDVRIVYSELLGKHFYTWVGVFILLKILDGLSTFRAFNILGSIEMENNPVARWFFGQFGIIPGMILSFVFVIVPINLLIIYFCHKSWSPKAAWGVMWLLNLYSLFVVFGNFYFV